MESSAQISPDTPPLRYGRRHGKVRLLTRKSIDGRTKARRQFDDITRGIAVDLGGEDRQTTVQKHLVEAFAGAALHVHDLNAKLLLGQQIDLIQHSQIISTLVRVASRIGLHRVAREVVSALPEYLDAKAEAVADAEAVSP